MGAHFSRSFIRTALFSCLTADITCQLPLPVFMGRLIEGTGGTEHHKLDRIQKRRLPRPVFSGKQRRRSEINRTVFKPVPVNQLHSRQLLHPSAFPFCISLLSHMPS